VSQFLYNYLNLDSHYFSNTNFYSYIPDFGGHYSNRLNANKIFSVRSWLALYIPVDTVYFSNEVKYVQEIIFPLPMLTLNNDKLLHDFLEICYTGAYRGLKYYFSGLNMEYHHVDQKQEKLIFVPKDFHKGFHSLLHSNKNHNQIMSKKEKDFYCQNRKLFLKFIGDSILYIAMNKGKTLKNPIKKKYFNDKELENFGYEYEIQKICNSEVHQFIYFHQQPI
jgi:hypothetical protein